MLQNGVVGKTILTILPSKFKSTNFIHENISTPGSANKMRATVSGKRLSYKYKQKDPLLVRMPGKGLLRNESIL